VDAEQPTPPTPDEIRAQLDRLLASAVFATTARLRRFLRYVVERSLAGEGDQLKEYAIGVAVFDRDEHYDPRIDSIVRVEAGRLRTKIDEHYNGAGAEDGVRIRIPRGGYAPVFERRQRAVAPPVAVEAPVSAVGAAAPGRRFAAWRPAFAPLAIVTVLTLVLAWQNEARESRDQPGPLVTIAVLPFACYSTDAADQMLAARLTDGVTRELARTGAVGVLSHASALQFAGAGRPLKEMARSLRVDLVVETTVEAQGEHLRIHARLVDALVDRKGGWMQSFEGRRADLPTIQRGMAAAITAAAQQYRAP
jgi:TolB-like protein